MIERGNVYKIIETCFCMEKHLKARPKKKIFPKEKIHLLRGKAVETIKSLLLPNDKIIKIF